MINILSYIGMSLQSEVCLWTLLGILRTIFDATLFKVNANLKQVWQMKMPIELSLNVQRVLRTMISGLMLVQCFTVYVYLASYIVLLYPVFLEERPTLVLPWLLLAAVRNLLCELTSLALGLGTCVLLGPARPPCIKFVIIKLASIMPAFYMWMLLFSYYHYLKMASAFKTFPAVLPPKDLDYGLELAVRRRRTKSLQDEDQLRKKLIASFYGEEVQPDEKVVTKSMINIGDTYKNSESSSTEDIQPGLNMLSPLSVTSNRTMSDIGTYEDWFGSEVVVPRDTDRILEQFVLMLLRIGVYMKKENVDPVRLVSNSQPYNSHSNKIDCPVISNEESETPPIVGTSKGRMASYLRDYPQIFMKRPSDLFSTLNKPDKRPQTNSTHDVSSQSSLLVESKKGISLDNNSLNQENKDVLPILSKKTSNTTIKSTQEDNVDTTDKQIEDVSDTNNKTTTLTLDSTENSETILNRIKIRAASSDDPKDSSKENIARNEIINRVKNHALDNRKKSNVKEKKLSDNDPTVSNKDQSNKNNRKYKKK